MAEELTQVHALGRLLAEAQGGSQEALGRLLQEYRPYLLHIALDELDADVQAKEGASDLVQRSFMEAVQGFERFTGQSPDDFRMWLRQILSNNIKDLRDRYQTQMRRVSRETGQSESASGNVRPEGASAEPSPSETVVNQELLCALEDALAKLSDEQRELIRLRQRESKSFVEIARLLGTSEDAVQKRWARAVEELRQMLDVSSR